MSVRTWPEQGGSQTYRQGDRQEAQELKKAIECSFFLAKLRYVTAYAQSSTQRQKVRCYSTREKNSYALAHAAYKISMAFDQDKCATGVRALQAHTESNRRAMTFLPSKFLLALLLRGPKTARLFNSCGHDPKDAGFACTACHDSHEDLKQGDTAYDAKCTTCHAVHGAEQATGEKNIAIAGRRAAVSSVGKSCPVASERCVSCHMPKVELPGGTSSLPTCRPS